MITRIQPCWGVLATTQKCFAIGFFLGCFELFAVLSLHYGISPTQILINEVQPCSVSEFRHNQSSATKEEYNMFLVCI